MPRGPVEETGPTVETSKGCCVCSGFEGGFLILASTLAFLIRALHKGRAIVVAGGGVTVGGCAAMISCAILYRVRYLISPAIYLKQSIS